MPARGAAQRRRLDGVRCLASRQGRGLMPKGNRPGHRRFGNVRRLPSGRYQASYLGLDALRKYAPETFERKADAERFLALVETQLGSGDWANPARAKVRLGDYARV